MLNIKMFSFIFFIAFEFDFVVKVYAKSTPAYGKVDDYDMEYMMQHGGRVTRVPEHHVTQTTPSEINTSANVTDEGNTTTINTDECETIDELPSLTVFMSLNHLMTMYPEMFVEFNKTVKDLTRLVYGEPRPDKYQYIATLILEYLLTVIRNLTKVTIVGSLQTVSPHEDYPMTTQENTRKIFTVNTQKILTDKTQKMTTERTQKITTESKKISTEESQKITENQFPTTITDSLKTVSENVSYFTTVRHITKVLTSHTITLPNKYQTLPKNNLWKKSNQLLGRQGAQYLPTYVPPYQTNPDFPQIQPDNKPWQGMNPNPEYYNMDEPASPGGFATPPRTTNNLLMGITTPPPFTTEHYIVKDVKIKMANKKHGYFTAFVQELCTIIAVKNPLQSSELYDAFEMAIENLMDQGRLLHLGIRFENAVKNMLHSLNSLEPDVVQSYASMTVKVIEEREVALAQDVQSLLRELDNIYTIQEGEELLNCLVPVYEYPKNESAFEVANRVVDKLFKPYFRTEGSFTRYFLIQSINKVMEKRSYLGYGRRLGDLDDRIGEKVKNNNDGGSVNKLSRRKANKKGKETSFFNEFNVVERNKDTIRKLIENFKALEAIKKYETKIVRTTPKYWPNFYKIHEKISSYGRRSNFDDIQLKNNKKSNNISRKNATNNSDLKDKKVELDDGILKYKLKTKQNAKIKSMKELRRTIHSEIVLESDGLYELTSESESITKTHEKIADKHINLNKLNKSNIKRGMNLQNMRKNKEQNRFNVVKKRQTEPSFDEEMHARDNKRRPNINKRHSNDKSRRHSNNRRLYSSKRRPPMDIKRPPNAKQHSSMYLTPRYKYNFRKFNENLSKLTRRSNAKPISTQLSYSNEENYIKFHIQDAVRHPFDLKSKIEQNSLVFDKVQNVRRQMAPVDRISLKEESNYSDDEGTIKNNIYKVFNNNN